MIQRPRKVLHIIDHLGLGGAQSVVKGLMASSQVINQELFLISLRKSEFNDGFQHHNLSIIPSQNRFSIQPLFYLIKMIRDNDIDILHCHLMRSQFFGWILKIFFFPGVRLIFHEHGKVLRHDQLTNWFLKISRSKVDAYIAVSRYVRDVLGDAAGVPDSKRHVIYNYVDNDKYSMKSVTWDIEEERQKLGYSHNDFVVGFAGRIIQIKGWRSFLSAAKMVPDRDDVQFLIAGDGSEKESLQTIIKDQGLEEKVNYLGPVQNMVWFYSLLDVFIITSWWEALGITSLEAQAMEIPVISVDVPALNEILTDQKDCLMVEPRDSEELALGIVSLLENQGLRNRLALNGNKNAESFSLDRFLDELGVFYDNYF